MSDEQTIIAPWVAAMIDAIAASGDPDAACAAERLAQKVTTGEITRAAMREALTHTSRGDE